MKQKTKNLIGLLLQIPLLFLLVPALLSIIKFFFLSFTEYNVISSPKFVGLNNYISILKDEVFWEYFSQTALLILALTVSLLFCAILPALFMSKLKAPFGAVICAVLCVLSITSALPIVWSSIFSGDMYALLNSFLLQGGVVEEPLQFLQNNSFEIAFLVLEFTLMAPTFCIAFVISKLKKPVLGASLSLCSIPVFTFTQAHLLMQLFGYPSSLCFLPHYFSDYLITRFEVGYAYAMLVLCIIALAIFCALLCLAVFGISKLVSFIKINAKTKTVLGYVFFGAGLSNVLPTVALNAMVLIMAVKPYNELFIFPPRLLPRSPTLNSFTQFFDLLENVWFSPAKLIASIIIYSLILFLVYAFTLLPSSIGVSILKTKYKPLLLLSLCSLIALSPQYHTSYEIFTIRVDYFLSGLFFLSLLFVGYFAVKSMLYNSKTRIIRIIIGTLTIITSAFSSAAISIMWCPYNDYNLSNNSMYTFLTTMSQSVARIGEGFAGSVLLLFSTVVIAFLPSLLIITLYVIRKIEKR